MEKMGVRTAGAAQVETRFRYNPDVKSLPAMAPAVMPMLQLMLSKHPLMGSVS